MQASVCCVSCWPPLFMLLEASLFSELCPCIPEQAWVICAATLRSRPARATRAPHMLWVRACTHTHMHACAHMRAGPNVERVVVHCMLSQVRGPRSAQVLASALERRGRTGQPCVLVLKGGWESFFAVRWETGGGLG